MSNLVRITVNQKEIEAENGANLLQTLLDNGIETPHFCYHEALGPDGNCRMCMVEIEGQKRPQIACDTFVEDAMVISTKSDNIMAVKRSILELELINHPVDCPICDQAGECKLQEYYMEVGLYDSRLDTPKVTHKKHIDLGSNVMLDQERCVLCERCARFTTSYTKTNELGIIGRGDHARIATMPGKKLDNPYAMNVVDICPVGALTSKDFRFKQRVWFMTATPSICQGCAKGCNIYIDHNKLKYETPVIHRYRPRKNLAVNGHFICDEGRLSFKEQNADNFKGTYSKNLHINFKKAISKMQKLLKSENKHTLIVLSPSLLNEQIASVLKLSKIIGANIFCPLEKYTDEDFSDDILRSSDRASNRWTINALRIETDYNKFIDSLDSARLIINFNHKLLLNPERELSNKLTNKINVHFSEVECENRQDSEISFAYAPFSYVSGSTVNENGHLQQLNAALVPTEKKPDLLELIHIVSEKNVSHTNEQIWQNEMRDLEVFENVNFSKIPLSGLALGETNV